MLQVTFQGPIVVSPENLPALLALAGVAAVVAPYVPAVVPENPQPEPAPVNRGRPRRQPQAQAQAPAEPPVPDTPKDATPADVPDPAPAESTSHQMDAAAATAGAVAGAATAAVGDLLSRFTDLVDKNYDGALNLLGQFGVGRFSDLKAEAHDAFSKALSDLGA